MPAETILIKNEYYPKGLTRERVEKHYKTYRNYILKEVDRSKIVLFFAVDTNQLIVRRNLDNAPIVLTKENYDTVMSKRVVSIAMELGSVTDLWFVDIDPGNNVTHKRLIEITDKIVELFSRQYNEGYAKQKNPKIVTTSSGFHIMMKMKSRTTVSKVQYEIKTFLENEMKNYEDVLINKKRKNENEIILDLSPLNRRGSRVVPYALNRNGLMCIDVSRDYKKWKFEYGVIS